MEIQNIYSNIHGKLKGELFESIIINSEFKLERIVSSGHFTPENEWYDQENDEWVLLLTGSACLSFINDSIDYELKPGDYILIPAHKKHRVKWTDPKQKTVWLALHFKEEKHEAADKIKD